MAAFAMLGALPPAAAQTQGVVAVVNDQPITEHDVTERIALLTILGDAPGKMSRKQSLQSLIDEQIKIAEATRFKLMPDDGAVRDQIARMSKGMDTTTDNLVARLKKQGVSETAFTRYVGALLGFNRILSNKYRNDVAVTDAKVDAKIA